MVFHYQFGATMQDPEWCWKDPTGRIGLCWYGCRQAVCAVCHHAAGRNSHKPRRLDQPNTFNDHVSGKTWVSPRGLFPLQAVGVFQSSIAQNVTSTCTCWRRSKSDFPYIIYPPVTSLRRSTVNVGCEHVPKKIPEINSTQLHIFLLSHPIFWTNVIWTILWILPVVLQFNFWVAKPHIHQHRIRIPSPCHHCFVNEFSGRKAICGDLKQVRSKFNESAQKLKSDICKLSEIMSKRSRLLCNVLMLVAPESLAHFSASLPPHLSYSQ